MAITAWQLENLYRNGIIDYVPYDLCYEPFAPNMAGMSNPYANGVNQFQQSVPGAAGGMNGNFSNQYSMYGNSNETIGNNYFKAATAGAGYNYNGQDSFVSSNAYARNNLAGSINNQPKTFKNRFRNFLNKNYGINTAEQNVQNGNQNEYSHVSEINNMKNSISGDTDSPNNGKLSNPSVWRGVVGLGITILLAVMGFKGCKKLIKKIFKKA